MEEIHFQKSSKGQVAQLCRALYAYRVSDGHDGDGRIVKHCTFMRDVSVFQRLTPNASEQQLAKASSKVECHELTNDKVGDMKDALRSWNLLSKGLGTRKKACDCHASHNDTSHRKHDMSGEIILFTAYPVCRCGDLPTLGLRVRGIREKSTSS
jgi:hypothetical protein